jgi:hypothetical protein
VSLSTVVAHAMQVERTRTVVVFLVAVDFYGRKESKACAAESRRFPQDVNEGSLWATSSTGINRTRPFVVRELGTTLVMTSGLAH